MTWEYEYDEEVDKTTIYWDGREQGSFPGRITKWRNGYPVTDKARETVAEAIQEAGTPERTKMQYDLNYGFERIDQQ